jgi:flavin-dependent thymidylate synthase
MKVTLIDCTGYGVEDPEDYAANILIFAKSTRLTMSPGLLSEIKAWPWEKKLKELEYIANTIPASHEFLHYTFLIEGVSRAFTHQLVRSRQFSYAQQTMRVLDVSDGPGWTYSIGPSVSGPKDPNQTVASLRQALYKEIMQDISKAYKELLDAGASIEDARGVLPTNIQTNIMMKGNLRNFCELVKKRSSSRTQGEYRDVLEQIKYQMMLIHPFTRLFIERNFDLAANELDEMLRKHVQDAPVRTQMIKLMDQMRGQS